MEHWIMKIANDPYSPKWWVWLLMAVILFILALCLC